MAYTILGTVGQDKKLFLSPLTMTEGEGVNTLDVAFSENLNLTSVRVEYEHPTGLNRRNRYASDYATLNAEGHLIVAIPPIVLSQAGKVYVQVTGMQAENRWSSLFSSDASFIVAPAIEAGELPTRTGGSLVDAVDNKISALEDRSAALQSQYEKTAATLTTDFETAVGGVQAQISAFIQSLDTTPTADSVNAVRSGGVAAALSALSLSLTTLVEGVQSQVTEFLANLDATPTAESSNAVRSGGVAAAIAALDAAKQPVGEYYSASNLPTRGTVENGNQFNPFYYAAGGHVWFNHTNGTNIGQDTIHIGNGRGQYGNIKAGIMEADEFYINNRPVQVVPDGSGVVEKEFPVGTYLLSQVNGSTAAAGDVIYVSYYVSNPDEYTIDESLRSTIAVNGSWVIQQLISIGGVPFALIMKTSEY